MVGHASLWAETPCPSRGGPPALWPKSRRQNLSRGCRQPDSPTERETKGRMGGEHRGPGAWAPAGLWDLLRSHCTQNCYLRNILFQKLPKHNSLISEKKNFPVRQDPGD